MARASLWRLALLAVPLSLVSQLVNAVLPDGRFNGNIMPIPALPRVAIPDAPVTSRNGTELPPYNTTYYFDQLIDHDNPSLGTFKQRFWHTWEFYEPGGPIVFMTPGESNAQGYTGYLTNRTINGLIAQQQNGSTIVLEHRFYGLSNPRPNLSVESLRLHTIQQAIEDLVYFANNVQLPMPNGDNLAPGQAPWILVGGSYSGALTAYTMVNQPDVFFAGYSSSGVVEAIFDYWRYFEPIRQNMPKNCSADVEAVIAHVDEVLSGSNQTAIQTIKDNFGMGDMTHLDDVAGALRNNLWDWQALQITSGPDNAFRKFCDALEVKDGASAPESGWGLDHALAAWGAYWQSSYLGGLCGSMTAEDCLGTYNTSQAYWTDESVDNAGRSWFWIVCNEVGFLQDGPPPSHPAIVSRIMGVKYDLRQCQQMFPAAFPEPPSTIDVEKTNNAYDGWSVNVEHLFFANGIRDPWREATMSAQGLDVPSTSSQPIALSDGFHCSDLGTSSGIDPTVAAVQNKALASMKAWLTTWEPSYKHSKKKGWPKVDTSPFNLPKIAKKPVNAWMKDSGSF